MILGELEHFLRLCSANTGLRFGVSAGYWSGFDKEVGHEGVFAGLADEGVGRV